MNAMKPNVLLLVIDGLRADRFSGPLKTSYTPNMDKLKNTGIFFNQAVSSSDATWICVGSILSSLYPIQSGITRFTNHEKSSIIFDFMKKNGYHTFATVKNTIFFQTLTSDLDGKDLFPIDNGYLFEDFGNVGKIILDRLNSENFKAPWFHYIHIMDLHRNVDYPLPEEFKDEKYGNSDYDKMISGIDTWIGKILEKIDLKNTLVILTSDHGDFLPIEKIGHEMSYIPALADNARKIKQHTPTSLEPLGLKLYLILRSLMLPFRKKKLSLELSKQELRTLSTYGTNQMWDLFEEIIRVPLVFSGFGIPSQKTISQQVRHIDIFPTVMEILNLKQTYPVEGQSLAPLLHDKDIEEHPAIIQNMTTNPKKPHNVIGLRTPNYKYYRSIENAEKSVTLFDLTNDPHENHNIAKNEKKIVQEMEEYLTHFISNSSSDDIQSLDDEKLDIVADELKKLGYV